MSVLLFAGANYYPQGGWADFIGEFPTLEAARARLDGTRTVTDVPERTVLRYTAESGRYSGGTIVSPHFKGDYNTMPTVPVVIPASRHFSYEFDWGQFVINGVIVANWWLPYDSEFATFALEGVDA